MEINTHSLTSSVRSDLHLTNRDSGDVPSPSRSTGEPEHGVATSQPPLCCVYGGREALERDGGVAVLAEDALLQLLQTSAAGSRPGSPDGSSSEPGPPSALSPRPSASTTSSSRNLGHRRPAKVLPLLLCALVLQTEQGDSV